jgi:hypothetical protein
MQVPSACSAYFEDEVHAQLVDFMLCYQLLGSGIISVWPARGNMLPKCGGDATAARSPIAPCRLPGDLRAQAASASSP